MIRKSITKNSLIYMKSMYARILNIFCLLVCGICAETLLAYKRNKAPDGHRCGVCPTYFQKVCAFDFETNSTFIFDNHCIMDLYNCVHGSDFVQLCYDQCIYFGNFAYVHGFKKEDLDYDEDHIIIKGSKKNPDFMRLQ